jgi:ketosteroid isomerase-like protein
MEIEDFFKNYQDAAWLKDAKAMINLYDEHALIIFDMWDAGYLSNPSEWAKVIEDWLGSLGEEKVKVNFEMIKVRQSGNVGFASALIQYQAISGDGQILRSMKNRISLGFSKSDKGWKVTHQHTSAPISSDKLTAILNI